MTFSLKKKAPNPNGNPNFKPKWKLGNTIAIRIPEAIADLVISVARRIDNGELSKADISQLCLDNNAIALQLTALDIGKPSLEIVPPIETLKEGSIRETGVYETSQELKAKADDYNQKYGEALKTIEFLGEQLKKQGKQEQVQTAIDEGLDLIEQFEEKQKKAWGKSAKQTGEFKTDSPRWTKYNEFKTWVKSLVS